MAVLTETGEVVERRPVNEAERMREFFASLPVPAGVAVEASGSWWWLVDLLEELGHQPVLSHMKQTQAMVVRR